MKIKFTTALLILILSSNSFAQKVPEIPDPNLPDIAMVTIDGWGRPLIIYNPILCQQAGPSLCEFYRWHEYGHIMMGHTLVPKWPQIKELEADCWAAKNAPQHALQAAFAWFSSGGGASPTHGYGPQRAARIKACAGL